MVITADHDDRVVPAHSFKFAAALQAAGSRDPSADNKLAFDPKSPLLIRIETRAGHGAGKPTAKEIEEAARPMGVPREDLGVRASAQVDMAGASAPP